jgi:hypothetical protein
VLKCSVFISVLVVELGVSINTVICETKGHSVTISTGNYITAIQGGL